MIKQETMKKIENITAETMEKAGNMPAPRFKVSPENSKTHCPGTCLMPCVTCRKNCECLAFCYARALQAGIGGYIKSMRWAENTIAFLRDPAGVEKEIMQYCKTHDLNHFRFNVSGDFWKRSFYEMTVRIAAAFPRIHFLAFTKFYNYSKYNDLLPENYRIIYSGDSDGSRTDRDFIQAARRPVSVAIVGDSKKLDKCSAGREVITCAGDCLECGYKCWHIKNLCVKFEPHGMLRGNFKNK